MKVYQTKTKKLAGTDYGTVYPKAHKIFKQLKKKTRRRPYIRSTYFKNDKIFPLSLPTGIEKDLPQVWYINHGRRPFSIMKYMPTCTKSQV